MKKILKIYVKKKSSAKNFTKREKKRFSAKYNNGEIKERPSFAKRGERTFGNKPKRNSEERSERRDRDEKRERPSFAKHVEKTFRNKPKNNEQLNNSRSNTNHKRKHSSFSKKKGKNKPIIKLGDSYSGIKFK